MKNNTRNNARNHQIYVYQPPVPNAAPPSYFTDKMLDALTTAVSAMGFVAAMVFLVIMA
jgi:hypothetical protein